MNITVIITLIHIILIFLFVYVRFFRKKEDQQNTFERDYYNALSSKDSEKILSAGTKLGEFRKLAPEQITDMIQKDATVFQVKMS